MKKEILLITLITCGLNACTDEEEREIAKEGNEGTITCLSETKANGLKSLSFDKSFFPDEFWNVNENITIAFFNGTIEQRREVMRCCEDWMNYANITFTQISSTANAKVRVLFENQDNPNIFSGWSYMGTACLDHPKNEETVHLKVGNDVKNKAFLSTVRHELGHVLGFHHEHQSPNAKIVFNESVIKNELRKDNPGKSDDYIQDLYDTNYKRYEKAYLYTYSAYDPSSIMHYSFTAEEADKEYSLNLYFSAKDKKAAGELYPFNGTARVWSYYSKDGHILQGAKNYESLSSQHTRMRTIGKIYTSQVSNTQPVYAFYNTIIKDYLYTTNQNEVKDGVGGWKSKGLLGYAYTSAGTGRKPIYRYYNSSKGAHMLSDSPHESQAGTGYSMEGIAFYLVK